MSTSSGGTIHYDVNNEADLVVLIRNGLIWQAGPKAVNLAIAYLRDHPEAINSLVPTSVSARLQQQPVPQEAPVPQPVEQAPVTEQPIVEAPSAPPAEVPPTP